MNKLFLLSFVGILCLSDASYFLRFLPEQPKETIKEELVRPVLEGGNLRPFIDNFTEYYDKTFPGRYSLAQLVQTIKKDVFDSSPVNEVIIGKDGWLYQGAGTMYAIQDYLCFEPFTEEQITVIKQVVTENKQFIENINARYLVVIIPDKAHVYPEFLPDRLVKSDLVSRREQLFSILKQLNVNYIYLKDSLIANKHKGQLYYKTDTHWNNLGAAIGYNAIISVLNDSSLKPLDINELNTDTTFFTFYGDIGSMTFLGDLAKLEKSYPYQLVLKKPELCQAERYIATANGTGDFFMCTSNPEKKKKIVLFRDSFSGVYSAYLPQNFGQTTLFWTYKLQKKYLIEQQPDYVVHILAERFIKEAFHDNTFNFLFKDHGTFE